MFTICGSHAIPVVYADVIDQQTTDQIREIANHPVSHGSLIRIMGDCHCGKGAVIGYTQTCTDRICPNILGVDIGCSVSVTGLGKLTDVNYARLDYIIKNYVCAGSAIHAQAICDKELADSILDRLVLPATDGERDYYRRSIGSLGGGNHFIEVNRGSDGSCYLVIHCGSRRLGVSVHDYYMRQAQNNASYAVDRKALIDELKHEGRAKEIASALKAYDETHPRLTNDPLAYLTKDSAEYDNYVNDVEVCNKFSLYNHAVIRDLIMHYMHWDIHSYFVSMHNTIENGYLRKGATSAHKGQPVIVPITMAFGSVIGLGKGNITMNCSAPHGAGRLLSRSQARKSITMDSYRESMRGVYTTSVCPNTLDEAPTAYKSFDDIKSCLEQSVEVVDIIKPLYNFKATT